TDLILDLHDQHRVPLAIDISKMTHQFRERASIRISNCGTEGRKPFCIPPITGLNTRKARNICLYPSGCIARKRVLPRAEPQNHQLQIVRASPFKKAIDNTEVELPF